MTKPILREAFPGWDENKGIFDLFVNPPWSEYADAEYLNLEYFGNQSGAKYCSPLVRRLLSGEDYLSDESRQKLAKIIQAKFRQNWSRLWETNVVEYSPIHNYDMTETRETNKTDHATEITDGTLSHTGTDSFQHGLVDETEHGKTVTDKVDHGLVDTTDHGKTETKLHDLYGFNSTEEEGNPADKDSIVEGGTTVNKKTGTDTETSTEGGNTVNRKTGTDVSQKNLTDKDDTTKTTDGNGTENETIHRVGNIGVTTSQKMLEEERQLWLWNYFDGVYRDIDTVLALTFYDPCRV